MKLDRFISFIEAEAFEIINIIKDKKNQESRVRTQDNIG
jgi:hypothetical protein